MPPAARITDMHTCPMVTPGLPPIPHVGGPILPAGCPTVLIGGLPANTGRKMTFTGTTVLRLKDGKIVEEIGLDDGVAALTQLGLIKKAA